MEIASAFPKDDVGEDGAATESSSARIASADVVKETDWELVQDESSDVATGQGTTAGEQGTTCIDDDHAPAEKMVDKVNVDHHHVEDATTKNHHKSRRRGGCKSTFCCVLRVVTKCLCFSFLSVAVVALTVVVALLTFLYPLPNTIPLCSFRGRSPHWDKAMHRTFVAKPSTDPTTITWETVEGGPKVRMLSAGDAKMELDVAVEQYAVELAAAQIEKETWAATRMRQAREGAEDAIAELQKKYQGIREAYRDEGQKMHGYRMDELGTTVPIFDAVRTVSGGLEKLDSLFTSFFEEAEEDEDDDDADDVEDADGATEDATTTSKNKTTKSFLDTNTLGVVVSKAEDLRLRLQAEMVPHLISRREERQQTAAGTVGVEAPLLGNNMIGTPGVVDTASIIEGFRDSMGHYRGGNETSNGMDLLEFLLLHDDTILQKHEEHKKHLNESQKELFEQELVQGMNMTILSKFYNRYGPTPLHPAKRFLWVACSTAIAADSAPQLSVRAMSWLSRALPFVVSSVRPLVVGRRETAISVCLRLSDATSLRTHLRKDIYRHEFEPPAAGNTTNATTEVSRASTAGTTGKKKQKGGAKKTTLAEAPKAAERVESRRDLEVDPEEFAQPAFHVEKGSHYLINPDPHSVRRVLLVHEDQGALFMDPDVWKQVAFPEKKKLTPLEQARERLERVKDPNNEEIFNQIREELENGIGEPPEPEKKEEEVPKRKEFVDDVRLLTALVKPGDALYIPAGWWHHVDAKRVVDGEFTDFVRERTPGAPRKRTAPRRMRKGRKQTAPPRPEDVHSRIGPSLKVFVQPELDSASNETVTVREQYNETRFGAEAEPMFRQCEDAAASPSLFHQMVEVLARFRVWAAGRLLGVMTDEEAMHSTSYQRVGDDPIEDFTDFEKLKITSDDLFFQGLIQPAQEPVRQASRTSSSSTRRTTSSTGSGREQKSRENRGRSRSRVESFQDSTKTTHVVLNEDADHALFAGEEDEELIEVEL
ncbi:unnamed protein product [Amoebophrya sp. A120]|nr:unnamed protein product [Amoebophrya sp. A120]|eukprot:GSA120T00001752001.1